VPRYALAVLGGTFDRLHAGHAALLSTAFRVGRTVAIGLTTPEYLARHAKPLGGRIQPYAVRRRALLAWLRAHYPRRSYRVVPLRDGFGRSTEEGVGVLVVSADTAAGGRAVNRERRRLGRRPVPVIVVPIVLADDLLPVSSRRIRAGVIDRDGHRRAPIKIGVAAMGPDRKSAREGVRIAFPSVRVRFVSPGKPGTGRARASAGADRALRGRELGVGIVADRAGDWWVALRSRELVLPPRRLRGPLADVLASVLRPRVGRKAF
jgi:pantetheine-phosphate adenylyltransferase